MFLILCCCAPPLGPMGCIHRSCMAPAPFKKNNPRTSSRKRLPPPKSRRSLRRGQAHETIIIFLEGPGSASEVKLEFPGYGPWLPLPLPRRAPMVASLAQRYHVRTSSIANPAVGCCTAKQSSISRSSNMAQGPLPSATSHSHPSRPCWIAWVQGLCRFGRPSCAV